MSETPRKTIARSLGESVRGLGIFMGQIVSAAKTDVSKDETKRHVVNTDVQEVEQGKMTMRRTTIDEIEMPADESYPPTSDHDNDPPPQQ